MLSLWFLLPPFVVLVGISMFVIRRHLIFTKYIHGSQIPFLKIKSYISGSLHVLNTSNESGSERIDRFFYTKGNTYGAFMGEVPYIFTKDLDLIQRVWVKDSYKHINRPYIGSPTEHNDVSLLQARDDIWRRTRRAIGSTMTPSKLKAANVERDVDECLDKLMASLRRRSNAFYPNGLNSVVVDCNHLFKIFIMDTFLNVAFDQPNQIDYDIEENMIVASAKDVMKKAINPIVIWTLYIHELTPIVRFLIKIFKINNFVHYLADIIDTIINKMVDGQKKDISERKMIHSLLDLYNDNKLSKDELLANTFFMLMAGWDTTSDSLTALMWHLARHGDIQDKLRVEVLKDGANSKYLEWVIKESLRLKPPANTAREITEDFHWNGFNLMKGMVLCMLPYSIQRDEDVWGKDAHQFKPERFNIIGELPHPAQFASFGLGPRNCVGYHLAMLEMKMVTCRLILNYKIETSEATPKKLELIEGTGTVFFINILRDPVPLRFVTLDTNPCG